LLTPRSLSLQQAALSYNKQLVDNAAVELLSSFYHKFGSNDTHGN